MQQKKFFQNNKKIIIKPDTKFNDFFSEDQDPKSVVKKDCFNFATTTY